MKKLIAFCLLPAALLLAKVEDKETIRQTYPFATRLEIRNVNGSVRVTGTDRNNIDFVANKRIEAKTQDALEQGKREVRLEVQASGDTLRVCIEGPNHSSCGDGRNRNNRGDNERDYSVRFDFELQVPKSMLVNLRTVNGGVAARAINGAFDVNTVNGGITLEDMGSSGKAHTVNGTVKMTFVNTPTESVDAKTVNGGIEAAFPRNFHGNLRFKTMNGDVFTNYPATMMANEPPESETRNGRTVIRGNRAFGVKIGGGGPEHRFETLNGSIQIAER